MGLLCSLVLLHGALGRRLESLLLSEPSAAPWSFKREKAVLYANNEAADNLADSIAENDAKGVDTNLSDII